MVGNLNYKIDWVQLLCTWKASKENVLLYHFCFVLFCIQGKTLLFSREMFKGLVFGGVI